MRWLLCLCLLLASTSVVHAGFFGFHAPFYGSSIPGWSGRGAVVQKEGVVLVTAPQQSTLYSSPDPMFYSSWELALEVTLNSDHSGDAETTGREGVAVWVTRNAPAVEGNRRLYGGSERFDGLGVFLDGFAGSKSSSRNNYNNNNNNNNNNNYNNDGDVRSGVVNALLSESSLYGTSRPVGMYDGARDGQGSVHGSCMAPLFASGNSGRVSLHVSYNAVEKRIKISVSDANTPAGIFSPCVELDANLEGAKYLAISAANSRVAWGHVVVHSLEVYDLDVGDHHGGSGSGGGGGGGAASNTRFHTLREKIAAAEAGEIDEHPVEGAEVPPNLRTLQQQRGDERGWQQRGEQQRQQQLREQQQRQQQLQQQQQQQQRNPSYGQQQQRSAAGPTGAAGDVSFILSTIDRKLSQLLARPSPSSTASPPSGGGGGGGGGNGNVNAILSSLSDSVTELLHAHQADEIVRHFERVENANSDAASKLGNIEGKLSSLSSTIQTLVHGRDAQTSAGGGGDGYSAFTLILVALFSSAVTYGALTLIRSSSNRNAYKLP